MAAAIDGTMTASGVVTEPVVWVTAMAGTLACVRCQCGWRVPLLGPGVCTWRRVQCPLREAMAQRAASPSGSSALSRSRSTSTDNDEVVEELGPGDAPPPDAAPVGCAWTCVMQVISSPSEMLYEFLQWAAPQRGCPKGDAVVRDWWRRWFKTHYPYAPATLLDAEYISWPRLRVIWKQRHNVVRSGLSALRPTVAAALPVHSARPSTAALALTADGPEEEHEVLWAADPYGSDVEIGPPRSDDEGDADNTLGPTRCQRQRVWSMSFDEEESPDTVESQSRPPDDIGPAPGVGPDVDVDPDVEADVDDAEDAEADEDDEDVDDDDDDLNGPDSDPYESGSGSDHDYE